MSIDILATIQGHELQFEQLLINGVNNGASIGFIAPLGLDEAKQYWLQVDSEVQQGNRLLLAQFIDNQLAGAIQLSLCQKANGRHRAEVEKLMVHTDFRQHGIAKQLLVYAEQVALDNHRTLLVLDTRTGDVASHLYRRQGYIEVGQIPDYVCSSENKFESTTYFYKQLSPSISL
ncbi:GNAT family N-acetyltransferase [Providencia burhodogranariea]|uniref:Acetyltransferase n=1 Tax=Providencia burhodogranariea DSM 19968 TaxID=1141662 RepID=K8WPB6_9GAMM|nr:GNAT family N-acetyltransferase [Providencia burhodogranariea]EKT62404.1 acetyltransferase [Providencia burhodogranariea DSM 19968]